MLEEASVCPLLSLGSQVIAPRQGRSPVARAHGIMGRQISIDVAAGCAAATSRGLRGRCWGWGSWSGLGCDRSGLWRKSCGRRNGGASRRRSEDFRLRWGRDTRGGNSRFARRRRGLRRLAADRGHRSETCGAYAGFGRSCRGDKSAGGRR